MEFYSRPETDARISILLQEKLADLPGFGPRYDIHEWLTLWPVPGDGEGERTEYVDILTDGDGDGVGDVNERIAGTDPDDPDSTPGDSVVDVLVLYNEAVRDRSGYPPYARIHHLMTVTRSLFADSAANLRIRTVGISEVELDEWGDPSQDDLSDLSDRHGADVTLQIHAGPNFRCGTALGCSGLGGAAWRRGYWRRDETPAVLSGAGAHTAAHELGHAFGLVHSGRQGEADGAFRWSRGYYIDSDFGTVMSYGLTVMGGVFSDPEADCGESPCGVPVASPFGAHAVASLDILRYQIAANRDTKPDVDGDGFVDAEDAFPDDSTEWVDADGDGEGDNTDPDDDNDGVDDNDDRFPLDPTEWADADGDGVGDNEDEDVVDLGPFRDPGLRDAVAEALGWASDPPPSEYDLSPLTTLDATNRGIRDLTGLELATNLQTLYAYGNEIDDLSPLAELEALSTLRISRNEVADLSPLADSKALSWLEIHDNKVDDLAAIKELDGLRILHINNNPVTDLTPLMGLTQLEHLYVSDPVTDLSPLSTLRRLEILHLRGIAVPDLSFLADFHELRYLYLFEAGIADVAPLADFRSLRGLGLHSNNINDVSPLSRLTRLESLNIGNNPIRDLTSLQGLKSLVSLDAWQIGIDDLAPLTGLKRLEKLNLATNRISDLSPLSTFCCLRHLDLIDNRVSNIRTLVDRNIWNLDHVRGVHVRLVGNPLDHASFQDDVAVLESWGIDVEHDGPCGERVQSTLCESPIADPALRDLVAQALAGGWDFVDGILTERELSWLRTVKAFNAGISDLAGIEAATWLRYLYAGSNSITGLGPLANLEALAEIDLSHNLILDIAPLTTNTGIGEGDRVSLTGNPLTQTSLNTHVPALREAGALVAVDSVAWTVAAGGGKTTFETAGYFASLLGSGIGMEVEVDDPGGLASVGMAGSILEVMAGTVEGRFEVTVTATDDTGETATLVFQVAVVGCLPVQLFPSAGDRDRQGFVRVINPSREAVIVRVDATDDDGGRAGPVWLALKAGAAAHFNSTDLENGNPGKNLVDSTGQGTGDWRLDIASELDIEVLSYVRTTDGFLTAMHDVAPQRDGAHHVAIFNPGRNADQESLLRLVNPGTENATVTIRGVDDHGASPGTPVEVSVPAGASRTYSAADLEEDGLGVGVGKWALTVSADRPIHVVSLLSSPTGHLTNLSTVPVADGGTHAVPLFPSMSDSLNRQGFVRVVNRSESEAQVTIAAFDETNRDYDALMLTVGAGRTVHFNSDDLEMGNDDKGLSGNTGAGQGHWRLELTSDSDIDVLSYIRTTDGFLTSMHDTVPEAAGTYHVATFNPGRNVNQISRLRLINGTEQPAQVTISGTDDAGAASTTARTSVPVGTVRSYTASELETGTEDLDGALGTGSGKWRLVVESDPPITVLNLLESPTGHLTNLSTTVQNADSSGKPR